MHRRSSSATRPTTVALAKVLQQFPAEYLPQHEGAYRDAHAVWATATLGHEASGPDDRAILKQKSSSLLPTWFAFWDSSRGLSGSEVAARSPRYGAPVLRAALAAIGAAQGIFGEVLAIDEPLNILILRDLHVDRLILLRSGGETLKLLRRWWRVITLGVPMGDGTWLQPSIVHGGDGFNLLSPDDVLKIAAEVCALPTVSPSAFGELTRQRAIEIVPTLLREAASRTVRQPHLRHYVTTMEGDRFEAITAIFVLGVSDDATLASRLRTASDMKVSPSGNAFFWFDRSHEEGGMVEGLAEIQRRGTAWEVRVLSDARLHRVAERMTEALGHSPPAPREHSRVRPWEENPDLVDAPGPNVSTIVMKNLFAVDGRSNAVATTGNSLRLASLDKEIPMLGGKPRELVATPEGRARVEAWLCEQEKIGTAESRSAGVSHWVDADPLRAALGLPTVEARYDLRRLLSSVR